MDDFESWLHLRAGALDAWGRSVVAKVKELVEAEVGPQRANGFFKIEPGHRVKGVSSALEKQERKNYADPRNEMTDLVGARFVLLLLTDVEVVERAINNFGGWVAKRERHFEDEIYDDPEVFEYQSAHYLVYSMSEFQYNGVTIPSDTACEVQVRTLLQHAYAELAHDNIYKSKVKVPAAVKRLVARGMALMESTDVIFKQAVLQLESVVRTREEWLSVLRPLHTTLTGLDAGAFDESDAVELLDTYRHLLEGAASTDVAACVDSPLLRAKVKGRSSKGLFRNPVCAAVYWLVENHHHEVVRTWPLPVYRADLETVCADLGKSAYSM